MMDITEARSHIFARLTRCPVCGATPLSAEKSDALEVVEFTCEARFYLQHGGIAAVSRICPIPSHVAMNQIERQAEDLARQAAA